MSATTTLREIHDSAKTDLRDRWENYRDEFGNRGEYVADVIAEIADGSVPVYYSELLELAAQDNNLALNEPELGPAFDGAPTPVNIIAANVYESVTEALYEEWRAIVAEVDDDSVAAL
jgi:hypothetical protein